RPHDEVLPRRQDRHRPLRHQQDPDAGRREGYLHHHHLQGVQLVMSDRTPPSPATGPVELGIERLIVASRWLQVPLYLGLVFVLGVVVVKFPFKLWDLVRQALVVDEGDLVLGVLSLVDLILVANLVVMVIISGYENFVSRIDPTTSAERLAWFGKLDHGSLK